MKTEMYQLWTFDVWGNEEMGYEVNNRFRITPVLPLPESPTDEQVFEAVRQFLKPSVKFDDLVFNGDDEIIDIDDRTGYPLFSVERIR